MLAILILLHLPIFLVPVNADVPPCTDGVVRFSLDDSTYTYYPNNTNGNAQFPQNYACDYQIIVPQGWFAKVWLVVKTDARVTKAPVLIVDALNRTEEVSTSDSQGFFFTAKGGTIKLATGNGNVNFGFILTWHQFKVNAETKVAVIAKTLEATDTNKLRGIIFFDGDSGNSTSLGTGLQLWNSQSQYVSSGNCMTIMNLESGYDNSRYEVWVQDYELSKSFVQIQNSIKDKYGVNYVLDGSSGASALYNTIKGVLIGLEGSGTLNVYSGTMKETNRLASYS
ncbi:hypothetical protein CAEBREN_11055 [Caenorhabditis brenneri]|uniref:DUF7592 domain-containing protein n=1 Tax=Caenorhabditis brenneri TaxID=135651 RepID=G0PLF3_CAEBE|nr:hypothetical protein CAEBREN_11055 [Caenorhabditis brenneri]